MNLPHPHLPKPPALTYTTLADVPDTTRDVIAETLAAMKGQQQT